MIVGEAEDAAILLCDGGTLDGPARWIHRGSPIRTGSAEAAADFLVKADAALGPLRAELAGCCRQHTTGVSAMAGRGPSRRLRPGLTPENSEGAESGRRRSIGATPEPLSARARRARPRRTREAWSRRSLR
jgi:hypothetical protein